jgi:hypothetical protein
MAARPEDWTRPSVPVLRTPIPSPRSQRREPSTDARRFSDGDRHMCLTGERCRLGRRPVPGSTPGSVEIKQVDLEPTYPITLCVEHLLPGDRSCTSGAEAGISGASPVRIGRAPRRGLASGGGGAGPRAPGLGGHRGQPGPGGAPLGDQSRCFAESNEEIWLSAAVSAPQKLRKQY